MYSYIIRVIQQHKLTHSTKLLILTPSFGNHFLDNVKTCDLLTFYREFELIRLLIEKYGIQLSMDDQINLLKKYCFYQELEYFEYWANLLQLHTLPNFKDLGIMFYNLILQQIVTIFRMNSKLQTLTVRKPKFLKGVIQIFNLTKDDLIPILNIIYV